MDKSVMSMLGDLLWFRWFNLHPDPFFEIMNLNTKCWQLFYILHNLMQNQNDAQCVSLSLTNNVCTCLCMFVYRYEWSFRSLLTYSHLLFITLKYTLVLFLFSNLVSVFYPVIRIVFQNPKLKKFLFPWDSNWPHWLRISKLGFCGAWFNHKYKIKKNLDYFLSVRKFIVLILGSNHQEE